MVERFALDQLVEDAKVPVCDQRDDPFGFGFVQSPASKTRRCRSAAFRNPDGTRGGHSDGRSDDRATVVPLSFCRPTPKVQIGSSGMFKPVATKAKSTDPSNSMPRRNDAASVQHLQPPVSNPRPVKGGIDEQPSKRQRTSASRLVAPRFWVPSFRGQGSLTGIPLDSHSGVRPVFPSQPPAQFVQPSWPDPAMLKRLGAGSAADLQKATQQQARSQGKDDPGSAETLLSLQQTVSRMGCMVETLNAKVSAMQETIQQLTDLRHGHSTVELS